MLTITLQDLRYRARQFLIAVVGAGLVFAMSLLLSGMVAGFGYEINQTVQAVGADTWVAASGAAGRVAALPAMAASAVAAVAREPGVVRADPILVVPWVASLHGAMRSVVVIGYRLGGLGSVAVTTGHPVRHSGQVVVDVRSGLSVGDQVTMSGRAFTVVGTVHDRTLLAGTPDAYVSLPDAQAVAFGGHPLISAVVTKGVPSAVPAGMHAFSPSQIEAASLDQMSAAASSIDNSRLFMWFIAAVIVAALVYVTALDRTRDFAVLKALGSSSGLLFAGLAGQAVVVALFAAAMASIIANFMTGLFAQPVDIPASAFVVLPVSAVIVGLLASLAALRRAVAVDPAVAFAGA